MACFGLRRFRPFLGFAIALAVLGCGKEPDPQAEPVRPVRTVIAAPSRSAQNVVLTGHIEAETEAALGFRIGGRLIERTVNIGDEVDTAQVVAKLDPQDEVNALRSVQAALEGAEAQLTQARESFERQQRLLSYGHASRAQFDQAQQELRTAQSRADDAQARLKNQGLRVSWTVLQADAPGTVSAIGAEPGEVVQPGQMIARIARKDGRDAVFDVPGRLLSEVSGDAVVTVRLIDDPSVTTPGRVREVGVQADPVTRTFKVRIGLANVPREMRLGTTVTGAVELAMEPAISIPASALTTIDGKPAVWIVDPEKLVVSLHGVEALRFEPDMVLVASGLDPGDLVVTAGVHALHPGQKVRLLGQES